MAGHGVQDYSSKQFPFQIDSQSFSLNDVRRHTLSAVGKYKDFINAKWKIGNNAPSCVSVDGLAHGLYIENYTISREAGDKGIATFNLVEASSSNKPYAVSATVDLQSVEQPLVMHPLFSDQEVQKIIRLWENTDPAMRVSYSDNKRKFRYIEYKFDSSGNVSSQKLVDIEDENAIKYCSAAVAGISNFMIYLPVIEVTSQYMTLPGVTEDDNHSLSGTLNPSDISDLGTYCSPPFSINGFSQGKWFKSVDRFTQNTSGTWQRTEQWTYTNDLRFTWIYDDKASTQVITE